MKETKIYNEISEINENKEINLNEQINKNNKIKTEGPKDINMIDNTANKHINDIKELKNFLSELNLN